MISMIKRRTFLSALPLGFMSPFLAACAQAQPTGGTSNQATPPTAMSGQVHSFLGANAGAVVWLKLTGTVRLVAGNANPRPATLLRAVTSMRQGEGTRFFDVWQEGQTALLADNSPSRGPAVTTIEANDLGVDGITLNRALSHPAFVDGIEFSRLSPQSSRVLVIDKTQISLLDGAVGDAPAMDAATQAKFNMWKNG
jgi:hypothetical protein